MFARAWAVATIGWSLVRTTVAWAALRRYGLDPWTYLVVDLSSAVVLAVSTPRMVIGFVDDRYRSAAAWALVSLVAFVAPDTYIFLDTTRLPIAAVATVCAVVTITLTVSTFGVARKVRAGRASRVLAAS